MCGHIKVRRIYNVVVVSGGVERLSFDGPGADKSGVKCTRGGQEYLVILGRVLCNYAMVVVPSWITFNLTAHPLAAERTQKKGGKEATPDGRTLEPLTKSLRAGSRSTTLELLLIQ
jgi:hypothetical protein